MKNLFSFFRKKQSSGVFVPKSNSFEEVNIGNIHGSINEITKFLNYHTDQVYTYLSHHTNRSIIQAVIFEVFTKNIVFVLVKNKSKKPNNKIVNEYCKDYDPEIAMDSLTIRDLFLEAVKNKSLSVDYLSRVLGFANKVDNGDVYVEKIEMNLYFINGILHSFKRANDLGEWARYFKKVNPDFISNYSKISSKFWGEKFEYIFNEVNAQADSFAVLENNVKNEFIPLHTNKFGTVNYLMLLVCHYGKQITLGQFLELNYGRYNLISETDKVKIYSLNRFKYTFDKNGKLLNSKRIK